MNIQKYLTASILNCALLCNRYDFSILYDLQYKHIFQYKDYNEDQGYFFQIISSG